MHITFADRLKAILARDKYGFWFKLATDEEKKLRRMDSWELVKIIHEASVCKRQTETGIVAGHILKVRIARIQSRATYVSIAVGFIGVLVGAALSVLLS